MASSIDSIFNSVSAYGTHNDKAAVCYCPACLGLQCLERPRFFAGQLLTEAELNSEQAYVIAKNKLHNRYLHGWGVVCGLQVVCHDCDGWVTVKQGYAIDPCGNDIIVCEEQGFDVIKAIRECREGRRRRRRADCDPVREPADKGCSDVEEHWCITIEYVEKEARPTTTLRTEKKGKCGCGCGSSCGCGCGGNGNGNGKSKGKSCGCGCGGGTTTSTQVANAQCEPTRIYEQFRLNVVEEPRHCAVPQFRNTRFDLDVNSRLPVYMSALGIQKSQQSTVAAILKLIPPDSLLGRILHCLLSLAEFIESRLTPEEIELLKDVAGLCWDANATPPTNVTQDQLHRLCTRLHRLVSDLYAENPMNVRCDYSCAPCPPVVSDSTATPVDLPPLITICCSLKGLIDYAVDCICQAFLPPCPPNPMDDRLILACLTIKDCKIVNICNFSCRHYAGSFPSFYYWLSLVPIIPLFGKALQFICCNEDLVGSLFGAFQRNDQFRLADDLSEEERRSVRRKNMGDSIRNVILTALTQGRTADAPKGKGTPETDLNELKEQLRALQNEVENLKRGERS